ncbi:MAG TPA: Dabb family protein [Chitinophagaceae bacterium]|nr:Dabb family protein [Chitinophagaceae bacterium]
MKIIMVVLFALTSLAAVQAQKKTDAKMLRHVVLFKFKDGTSPADVKKVEEAFGKLPSQITEIAGYEWGTNNSPENLNQGFTHCFFVSFRSEKDRGVYLPHPAHQAFVDVLKPHLDKVLVIDYWAN